MYKNQPSKLHQLPFDQGVQIVISPSSVVYVPEPIEALSDGILHRFCLTRIHSHQSGL